jgi:hypothetical protein
MAESDALLAAQNCVYQAEVRLSQARLIAPVAHFSEARIVKPSVYLLIFQITF